jgi:uncharacterized protein (DUF927 family)/5S rRNA maturation endonuclease (ribonuclease M5)
MADAFAPLTEEEVQTSSNIIESTKKDEIEVVAPIPATAGDVADFAGRITGLGRRPDAVWTYRDETGAALFHIARWDSVNSKEIRPICWVRNRSGEAWVSCHFPKLRPLYNLDLIAAAGVDAPIVVVEGEKTADAARAIFTRSVVTTSSGGSSAAEYTNWAPIAGRPVLIWSDCDENGRQYGEKLARKLGDLNCVVRMVRERELAAITYDGNSREPIKGWDAADALAEGWDAASLKNAVFESSDLIVAPPRFVSWGSYTMRADGLFTEREAGRGENKTQILTKVSSAFEVIGRARDAERTGWARLLRWHDEDGAEHSSIVSDAEMHSDAGALAARLVDSGLMITPGAPNRAALVEYLSGVHADKRVTIVHRTGWHQFSDRFVFVTPGRTFGPPGEQVLLQGGEANPYGQGGTLADWRESVSTLASGHKRAVFSISCAFAGTLLGIAGLEGGGVNWVGQSSIGKSTLIFFAASVWGRTDEGGFVRPWRATANALEAVAALHTDTLLPLDELGQVDAYDAAAAVYALSAGVGKGRSSRTGDLRNSKVWRVMILSTGEVSLADKIMEAGRQIRAGQEVRLLDIRAADESGLFGVFDHAGPFNDPAMLAQEIKQASRKFFGTAGPAFVSEVAPRVEEVREYLAGARAMFIDREVPRDADGQVRRAADRFAIIAAAGEMAILAGIVNWNAGEAIGAASAIFADWLSSRGGVGPAEERQAIARVREFLGAHGETRFDPVEPADMTRPASNRVGYRRGAGRNREWLILSEAWRGVVCIGMNPGYVARVLERNGMLRRGPTEFSRKERVGRDGTARVYVVTSKILNEGESDGQ